MMSKKYELFEVDDFVTDDFFVRWVQDRDEESEAFWHRWLLEHPEQEKIIEEATELIQLLQGPDNTVLLNGFYDSLKKKIDETIANKGTGGQTINSKKVRFNWYLSKVAASLLVIFLIAASVYFMLKPNESATYSTKYGEMRKVVLPDSSEVLLNANSSLSYEVDWNNDNRKVEINGEALFHVRHMIEEGQKVPFLVTHQNAQIEVLGTVFAVKSRNNDMRVVLKEGSVRFSVKQKNDEKDFQALLSPGDVLHYEKGKIEKKSTDINRYLAWTRQELQLEHTPLKEACIQLQEYFGTAFIIQDPALEEEPLNGTLNIKSEKELMLTLSVLLKVPVTKSADSVIIGKRE